MSIQQFEIINKLGEGAFSHVFKARRKQDNKIYAIKKIRFGHLKPKERENQLNEIRILASIEHPHIIGYKDAFIDQSTNQLWQFIISIVMEFAEEGDLMSQINQMKRRNQTFDEAYIWDILYQTIVGLKALHDMRILHRDLKCANIFLASNNTVKLGDMNVSKVNKRGLAVTQTGTPYYASPEVWKEQPYNDKSDIWSLGCVIYEVATLNPPFRASDMEGLYRRVITGQYQELPNRYSQDLKNIIRTLLQVNPSMRPDCNQLLNMPVMQRHAKLRAMYSGAQGQLLDTIKLPRNMLGLQANLPQAKYERVSSARPPNPLEQMDLKKIESYRQIPSSQSTPTNQLAHRQLDQQRLRNIYNQPPQPQLDLNRINQSRVNPPQSNIRMPIYGTPTRNRVVNQIRAGVPNYSPQIQNKQDLISQRPPQHYVRQHDRNLRPYPYNRY